MMKHLLLTTLLVCLTFVVKAEVPTGEKDALIDFYNATHGEEWVQQWDINTPVTDWQGVTVENNTVTSIRLLFNNLKGEIPASIANLKNLRVLELSFNKISGALPEEITQLSQLEILAFNGNELTGTLPASIGNLKNLTQLHLSSNKLTGTIPTSINELTALEIFNVFDNDFFGALPTKIARSRNLKEFMVAENNFEDAEDVSVILLSNSSGLDLNTPVIAPTGKSVIAIETSDDED